MSNIPRRLPLTRAHVEQIFPKLTPAQIRRIAARGHMRAMERGEVLYEQGDGAAPFFVVVSGELEVVRPLVPVEILVTVHGSWSIHGRGRHLSPAGGLSFACVPLSQVR